MKCEEEKTKSADQTRRISAEPKRTASSILPDEVQSNNKRRKKDDGENVEDASTVAENKDEQNGDEEVNKTNDQLPVVPLKELQDICIIQLNSYDWFIVHEAMEKLFNYCKKDQKSIDTYACREDIRTNHLIPCITCAMCRFVNKSDMIYNGLGLLNNICVKVSDSLTVESVVAIMNVTVCAMLKHREKVNIQIRAFYVLRTMFVFEFHLSTIQMISKNMCVLNLIVDAMKNHQNDKNVLKRGCIALNQYYAYMNDRKAMEVETCLEIVTKAMSYESCRKNAAKLMRLLSTQIELRE